MLDDQPTRIIKSGSSNKHNKATFKTVKRLETLKVYSEVFYGFPVDFYLYEDYSLGFSEHIARSPVFKYGAFSHPRKSLKMTIYQFRYLIFSLLKYKEDLHILTEEGLELLNSASNPCPYPKVEDIIIAQC